MAQEVFLEVVDELDRLVEQLAVAAAVHQDSFGSEHLGYFGQYGGAALCHEEVGEQTQQRVGRDARKAVGTSALQPDTEFAQRDVLAYVLRSPGVEFAQQLHAFLEFIVHLLGYHEPDALRVVFAQEFAECIRLVVFTSQPHDKYSSGIGVEHHVAQYLSGILVVVAQLRAAIVVRIGHDGIHTFTAGLGTQGFGQLAGNSVHTAYGRYNPDFVAYAGVAIPASVTFEGQLAVGDVQIGLDGGIGIFQQPGQVGSDVVLVHPVALLACLAGMPDGVAVFDDVLSTGQVFQRKLVAGRDVFVQRNALSFDVYLLACRQGKDGYGNIVCRIDF